MAAKKIKTKQTGRKSRKQLRKEERKNKKIRRNEYYTNRTKPGQFVLLKKPNTAEVIEKQSILNTNKVKEKSTKVTSKLTAEEMREKEKKEQMKLQKEMNKQRNRQLLDANVDEDRNIKRLEKQLKLNKRKSKSVPTSFTQDGLDYLLEVCEPENLESSGLAEQQLTEMNDEFEEDLVLMTEKNKEEKTERDTKSKKRSSKMERNNQKKSRKSLDEANVGEDLSDLFTESEDDEVLMENIKAKKGKDKERTGEVSDSDFSDTLNESFTEDEDDEMTEEIRISNKKSNKNERNKKKSDFNDEDSDQNDDTINSENDDKMGGSGDDLSQKEDDGTWEDIYGRLRSKDGSLANKSGEKYIPPAARMKAADTSIDKARVQELQKLNRQLKGLINRLAENNMHSIAKQIEELYMNNSRNNMNNTITNLVLQAVVSNVLAPERLLMEHILLVIILHANVGTEVGAHFLQNVIKQFEASLTSTDIENKKLDNIVIILAQLYNFKLFDSKLVYEIIDKLSEKFEEKDVECILHILRNVGFSLRKDNPLALKNLILNLQKKAANISDTMKDNSRVKFMLEILLAIKNNNVTKIPNYDTTYSEHLKKIMKGFIRKGNYVTQLNISLEDLLKADEKGKWWVIGSAWSGHTEDNVKTTSEKPNTFSQKLLDLATKQRMNTDARKNIFCIIMSAEDYLDAFEKLLRLALKNQQEREIIHVILHCCLKEKSYNPYYATLAQKFCEHDRKYQMTIKYSIWDKVKALNEHSATQISNLAKLLSHLFIEKGLPISTLKIIQFSELDKITLRFIRQILLGILLHDDLEVCKGVFEKVGYSDELKMFRESLKLFLHHFLLRNLDSQGIAEDKKELLRQRLKTVVKLLSGKSIQTNLFPFD